MRARLAACPMLFALAACQPAADVAPVAVPADDVPPPATSTPAEPIVTAFRCGDLLVGATFDNTAGTVTLSANGVRMVLPQALSGSGARYADDAGNEFWNKGQAATLTLDGAAHDCQQTDEVSPWDAARARGVVLRGVGNEPGWLVEVSGGDAPALRAQLDMGTRVVEARPIERTATGYRGTAADGAAIVLVATTEACSDPMSGQRFPETIELRVGDEALKGCGARLDR